ncbi:NAD-dependent protein deacetylase [bioreactor metagenome]|uniref:NAD-dependent protein deacetylase n=1 Tax=bioreactor metagenome TaxID=1076179 RepID=A0A645BXZ8_9ZZZZ
MVLYGEPLRDDIIRSAIEYIRQADMLIVGGTSLSVYPAAGLIDHYRGGKLVLINRTATNADGRAALCIREPIGETLGKAYPGSI